MPSGWVISSGLRSSRCFRPGNEVGDVLAHRARLVDAVDVLDLEQLHAVEVDDEVQAGDRVGVRARPVLAAVPDVRPADAPAAVGLRHEVRAVRPGVDQHAVEVGDPAVRERLDHARVAPQRLVALVELVDGHVRLAVGLVLPATRRDRRRARRAPCRPCRRRGSSTRSPPRGRSRRRGEVADRRLRGLAQLDRGEAPAVADVLVAAHDRGRRRGSRRPTAGRADAAAIRARPAPAGRSSVSRRTASARVAVAAQNHRRPACAVVVVLEREAVRAGHRHARRGRRPPGSRARRRAPARRRSRSGGRRARTSPAARSRSRIAGANRWP